MTASNEELREPVRTFTFPRHTLVSLLIFAVCWEVLSNLAPVLGIPPFAIPSLVRIAKSITTITPIDIVVTLARVMAALVASFVLGLALAMAMYRSEPLEKYLHRSSGCSWPCPWCRGSCSRCCGFPASNSASASCWSWSVGRCFWSIRSTPCAACRVNFAT